MVSALTFRILHGSRELALALVGTTQQFAVVDEALRAIGRPHAVADRPGAKPFVAHGGAIEFEDVTFAYAGRPQGLRPLLACASRPARRSALSDRRAPASRRSSASCSGSTTCSAGGS